MILFALNFGCICIIRYHLAVVIVDIAIFCRWCSSCDNWSFETFDRLLLREVGTFFLQLVHHLLVSRCFFFLQLIDSLVSY